LGLDTEDIEEKTNFQENKDLNRIGPFTNFSTYLLIN